MTKNSAEEIISTREDGVLKLRLNRASKKNSLTQAMYTRLATLVSEASAQSDIRVLVLSGSEDSFSAGNDMADFLNRKDMGGDAPVIQFMNALAACPKPVIASVNGLAVGVGVTMLLHCDLIYAAEGAKFQLPFVNLGIVPEFASSYLLPRIMGHAKAMELTMFGEPFSAEHARECGLVNEVLSGDKLEARVAERAAKLAAAPPNALRTTKRLMKRWTDKAVSEAIPLEAFHFVPMLKLPEAQEAIGAFLEKRKPDFSNFS